MTRNLGIIEPGLDFIARQLPLGDFGRLDILCRDAKGHYVIVELKRPDDIIDEKILSQLYKYRTGLAENKEYNIADPTNIRIVCLVDKMEPKVTRICEQAGIEVVRYDPNRILTGRAKHEPIKMQPVHGIFPVGSLSFFNRMKRYCFFDLDHPAKWIKRGSVAVFYSEKKLRGEAMAVGPLLRYEAPKSVLKFLHIIGYIRRVPESFPPYLLIHEGFELYPHPVLWEEFLRRFKHGVHSPPRHPIKIDQDQLNWIRRGE